MSQTWQGAPVVDAYGGNAPYAAHIDPGQLRRDADGRATSSSRSPSLQIVKAPNNSDRCTNLLTVTSYGVTRPLYPGLANTVTTSYGGEGIEIQRARVAALGSCGPPNKPQKKSTTTMRTGHRIGITLGVRRGAGVRRARRARSRWTRTRRRRTSCSCSTTRARWSG